MDEGIALIANADQKDLGIALCQPVPGATYRRGRMGFFLALKERLCIGTVSPDGMGRMQGSDAILPESSAGRQRTDIGNGTANIVYRIVPVHNSPGVSRNQKQAIGKHLAKGIDHAVCSVFNRTDSPHGGMDQHRIILLNTHGTDLLLQFFNGKH